ncbi:MAG: tail completion protein gp17 [Paracoccaceae bacterium]
MIGKVIKSRFTSDSDLNTLFGGRVFPVIGAQTKATPFAIYEVVNISTSMSKESDSHIDELDVRITLISSKYSDTQNGVEYVRSAFVRMNGTFSGVKVQSCMFEGQRDLFSDDERTFGSQCDLKFRVSRD